MYDFSLRAIAIALVIIVFISIRLLFDSVSETPRYAALLTLGTLLPERNFTVAAWIKLDEGAAADYDYIVAKEKCLRDKYLMQCWHEYHGICQFTHKLMKNR